MGLSETVKEWAAKREVKSKIIVVVLTLFSMLALMWILCFANMLSDGKLNEWGIKPRSVHGLIGIPLAPFLHDGIKHVAANSLPFLIFGFILFMRGYTEFILVTIFVILTGGAGTWLIGDEGTVHVGASGLIYGYFGFVIMVGCCEGKVVWSLIGIVVIIAWGALLWGVFKIDMTVSWEGHICGLLAGIVAASIVGRCICIRRVRKFVKFEKGQLPDNERGEVEGDTASERTPLNQSQANATTYGAGVERSGPFGAPKDSEV